MGAADLGRDRAREHDRRLLRERQGPLGRDLEETIGSRFRRLEFAVSDAAKGIGSAVTQLAKARELDPSAPTLEHGLDVFHTTMEAKRVLAQHWRRAEAAWETAEAADAKVAAAKRQGIDARGAALAAARRVGGAIERFEQVERLEAAWGRAHAALDLFDSDGRLNDRGRAEAEIAAAVQDLTGPDWSKVRNFLNDPRSLAFLDRMHGRLERPNLRRSGARRWPGVGGCVTAGRSLGPADGAGPCRGS